MKRIIRSFVRPSMPCVAVLVMLAGCTTVRAHERERLASRAMVPPFNRPGAGDYRDKIVQTRTGGALPGAVAGGGCGCTQ